MAQKKYSDWMRVDLHIHTDWSKKTKTNDYNGVFEVSTLKSKLIENDVAVFSMTDHNIINIEAYKEYYSTYNEETDPLLLLGIELDIQVNHNGDSRTYHTLIIFNHSNAQDAERIYNTFETFYRENGIQDKEREITVEQLVSIIPDEDFFFIPHAGNTKSIIPAYRGHIEDAQVMVLLMQSAFEKVDAKKVHMYNSGFDRLKTEEFKDREDTAYIMFSDNHNASGYPCKGKNDADHEFFYLKGSKSFETLRLAFIDPKSRIKTPEQHAELDGRYEYIESLKIEGDSTLEDFEISFSPHLNVLIGGRSSGKSLLMTLLADKVDGISIPPHPYKTDFTKGKIKSRSDSGYNNSTPIPKDDIIYIRQGEIVKYFENSNLEELAVSCDSGEEYSIQKGKFSDHKDKLVDKVEAVIESYDKFKDNRVNNRHVLQDQTLKSYLSEHYVFKLDHDSIKDEHDITDEIDETSGHVEALEENIPKVIGSDLLNWTDDELEIAEQFKSIIDDKRELLNKIDLRVFRRLHFIDAVKDIKDAQNRLLSAKSREKSDSIDRLRKFKNDIGEKFNDLLLLKRRAESLENFDYSLEKEVHLGEGVKLLLEVEKDEEIKGLILEGINGAIESQTLYANLIGLLRGGMSVKNFGDNATESLRKKVTTRMNDVYQALGQPGDYLKYDDGSSSKSNSPGFNSEKYLDLILKRSSSKYVFIDQPEDNLGNRFIAETLVDLLRDIKFQKQIFLVTHNPSVVVYGDAESVIIANNDGEKITYAQHVIENQVSQKEICGILDGGEYIFDMRSRKYNIQKLLKAGSHEQAS